jgi:hypothetical protein
MPDRSPCELCGVPDYISKEHTWLNNGDIVHSRDRARRVVFLESENIDPLLKDIEQQIGTSIEQIVIACVQKNIRNALRLFVSEEERERILSREIDLTPLLDTFVNISIMMGRGKLEILDWRFEQDENDFFTFRMTEPFSIPLCCGARAAGIEAILCYPHAIKYDNVSPDTYLMTVFPREQKQGFKGRMKPVQYTHVDGGLELEMCPSCGCPRALAQYTWHRERGVILSSDGKRMVMLSPYELDPVFHELEDELGSAIPKLVVEAQRRLTRSGFYDLGDIRDEDNLQKQLAFRGLGRLKELEIKRRVLNMRLENSVLALIVVGLMQGLFELAFDVDSTVGWNLSEDKELTIGIKA